MKTRIVIFFIFIFNGFFFNPTDTYAYCAQQAPRVGCGALQACPGTNNCCTTLADCTAATTSCTPNQRFCDGGRLKTCNATGDGIVPGSTVDCTVTNGTCVQDTGGARCQSTTSPGGNSTNTTTTGTSGGSGDGGSVNLNQVIDNTLVPLGFKFNSSSTLGTILTGLLPILYGLAGIGLLAFLITSGFSFLTSSGDPKKMEAAKGQITMAVLGFILIITAFWITQIVNYILGLGSGF